MGVSCAVFANNATSLGCGLRYQEPNHPGPENQLVMRKHPLARSVDAIQRRRHDTLFEQHEPGSDIALLTSLFRDTRGRGPRCQR